MKINKIPVYAVNVAKRIERKEHIINEFKNKYEFDLIIFTAIYNNNGALSLWETIVEITKIEKNSKSNFFILCEDDHCFSKNYKFEYLQNAINFANRNNIDILLGGVSWFKGAIQIDCNIFWVDTFTGLQFTIIFNHFYDSIINTKFTIGNASDLLISKISNKKIVMYPNISIQKEFGYSDVTLRNNKKGFVENLFRQTSIKFQGLIKINKYFSEKRNSSLTYNIDSDEVFISTIIISNKSKLNETYQIEFANRMEFKIVEEINRNDTSFFEYICEIIRKYQHTEDALVICSDEFKFNSNYNTQLFVKNILLANDMGIPIIIGYAEYFSNIYKVNDNLLWIDACDNIDFIVIMKNGYNLINTYKKKKYISKDKFISDITSNKLCFYPFIGKNNINKKKINENMISSITNIDTQVYIWSNFNK